MAGLLDRAPAWLRHALIVFFSAVGGTVASAVIAARGVTGVDWLPTLVDSLNAGALATVTGLVALWALPINGQYGFKSFKVEDE